MRTVPIRQSLHRHNQVFGAERELVMFSGLIAFLVGSRRHDLDFRSVSGAVLDLFTVCFTPMAKSDPVMSKVWLRHINQQDYYPARSSRWRSARGIQVLKLKDYRSSAKGLPDLLLYAALVAPGVVLNKDGSFLAAWAIAGQDTAGSTPEELAWVSNQVSNGIRMLGTGWMLHVDAIRSPHHAYPPPESGYFPDPVTRLIDEERRSFFGSGLCYKTETVLTVTFKPDLKATQMAQSVRTGVAVSGMEKALDQFIGTLAELEDLLSSVLRMERLEEIEQEEGSLFSSLLSHLQRCLTGENYPIRVPSTPMYLDALIGGVDVIGGLQPRIGEQYLSVLSLDGLPHESWPSMLAALDSIPVAYRYSTRFICLDQLDGTKEINMYRKGWQQQMFRFLDMFLNNPNARVNRDAQMMRDDAEEALLEVQTGLVGIGYLSSCIVLLNEDLEQLNQQTRSSGGLCKHLASGVGSKPSTPWRHGWARIQAMDMPMSADRWSIP